VSTSPVQPESVQRQAIACLGEVLIDQVVDPAGQRHNFPGGAPANVAVALARLGCPVHFIGGVGQDALGHDLVTELTQQGVDCAGVQHLAHPTRVVEVRCTATGDRQFGGFVGGVATDFADAQLAAAALPKTRLTASSALITGTLGLAYPATRAAMQQAADWVQARGGYLIVDLNWRPTFWLEPEAAIARIDPWLQRATWLKFSADEAIALFGTPSAAALQARFPSAHGLVVTDGAKGCEYAIAEQRGKIPGFTVAAQETTGAGDAFLAGMVYQLRQRDGCINTPTDIESMLTFANAYGALTTLRPGAIAAQPTTTELLQFLRDRTGQPWTL